MLIDDPVVAYTNGQNTYIHEVLHVPFLQKVQHGSPVLVGKVADVSWLGICKRFAGALGSYSTCLSKRNKEEKGFRSS